jgi:hypothetical protein
LGSGSQIRLFDMTVAMKNGEFCSFSGIDKKELEIIMEYFSARKIPVSSMSDGKNLIGDIDDESDEVSFQYSKFILERKRT